MASTRMKVVRGGITAMVAAGAFALFGPVGTASAINEITCNPDANFTKVYSHDGGGSHVNCYANAGKMAFGGWVDKVEAGNNEVFLYDKNGDVIKVDKWQTMKRNTPADITNIEIK